MKSAQPRTIQEYFAGPDVHDVQREEHGGAITCVIAVVVLLVEILLASQLLKGSVSVAFAAFTHLIIVGLLTFYARVLVRGGSENRFALLLALSTALTGPFGAAGVILTILFYVFFTRKAMPFAEWFDSIFPSVLQSRSQRIYEDIVVGRDESSKTYSVIPFLDVLSFGNEAQKRQALAKMTSSFHPNFAPAFKRALSDSSNTIRVQAATAITKIENLFLERLMKLSALKDLHPKDPVVVWALAEHCDGYAYTGLLDADREQANRRKALEHYQEFLHLKPSDIDAHTRVGRILMRNRDYEKALDWFKNCIEQGYVNESISLWYSEALFACGRFDELRYHARHSVNLSERATALQPVLKETLGLWSTQKRVTA
jgi:polysaccharide biosynthesis protein PelE